METNTGESMGLGLGFAVLSVGVAAAMVPLRSELGSTNPALVLVLLVVAAATVGGRTAGAIAALTASLAFNFFYTKPYLTLRVNSGRDILTIVLILMVGLAVGELGVARSRQSATRRSHLRSMRSLEQVGAMVSSGATAEAVWPTVRDGLVSLLGLASARFEAGAPTLDLPLVERDGRVDVADKRYIGDGFALPALGVTVNVEADGLHLGQIVLEPNPGVGVTREQRRTSVAIADQFAIAVARTPQVRSLV